jgi:hypothetical protein
MGDVDEVERIIEGMRGLGWNLVSEQLLDRSWKAEAWPTDPPEFLLGDPPSGFGATKLQAARQLWDSLRPKDSGPEG